MKKFHLGDESQVIWRGKKTWKGFSREKYQNKQLLITVYKY